MWHVDGHHGSLKVMTESGEWVVPVAIAYLDDCSRRALHLQWYLGETGENLAHCFSQGVQKHGLPRSVYQDNGKAELCGELRQGMGRLGVQEKHTRTYSPFMNGKEEHFWDRLEGRLVSMVVGFKHLTLQQLNDFTQAWVEMEYNRTEHRETKETPNARFLNVKDVGRPAPTTEELRRAFCIEVTRRQRLSDGTVALEGLRYEIPSRYRTMDKVHIHYARWDLGFVHIVDWRTGQALCRIYPIDKQANSDGRRRAIEDPVMITPVVETTSLPPLMEKLIADYNACGLPPAYIPKDDSKNKKGK
jgi:transposase InsO family protein